jgi:hypothetical protein
MGWSEGSSFMEVLITSLQKNKISKKARKAIYQAHLDFYEGQDWDTENEMEGLDPVFDETIIAHYIKRYQRHPYKEIWYDKKGNITHNYEEE